MYLITSDFEQCTGERPHCAYCLKRRVECQYDVGAGASKRAELERKLQEATSKSIELGIMLHSLRSLSDQQSTMLLARLRMGEKVDEIVQSLLQTEFTLFAQGQAPQPPVEGEPALPAEHVSLVSEALLMSSNSQP